jgi:RIO kinase 1
MPRIRVDDFIPDDDWDFDDFDDDTFSHTTRPARRSKPTWDVTATDPDVPAGASRSTYQESRASQGPQPPPSWLVTSPAALDYERGRVKTGKEADVDLVERIDPDTGASCLLAAKRYRSSQHRLFHRDAGYLEGRRVKRSRDNRAMDNRTDYGKAVIAVQWAAAEFEMLGHLWEAGVPVPYPVQYGGTDMLLEFIGDDDGAAAPRLAELRPDPSSTGRDELDDLFEQCRRAMLAMANRGCTHGDLSPYNLLVHDGRLVVIDLPQVVDLIVNPDGGEYLRRDCRNICAWFTTRGLPDADPEALAAELLDAAGL